MKKPPRKESALAPDCGTGGLNSSHGFTGSAVATLSRNFQLEWLRPLIGCEDVEIVLHSRSLWEILAQFDALALEVVLSNMAVPHGAETAWTPTFPQLT